MIFLRKIAFSFLFGIVLTSSLSAQEISNLLEIKTASELEQFEGRNILSGYFPLHSSSSNQDLKGVKEIQIFKPTSNFEADFFTKERVKISLYKALTMDFLLWGNKTTPATLFFEKVGFNKYKIIGYSKENLTFLPTVDLFPQFKEVDLINFDLEENAKVFEDRKLLAGGGLYTAKQILAGKAAMSPFKLSYPTCNFDYKLDGAYMTVITLSKVIDHATLEWISLVKPRNLIFEKDKNKDSFRLIGYASTTFSLNN